MISRTFFHCHDFANDFFLFHDASEMHKWPMGNPGEQPKKECNAKILYPAEMPECIECIYNLSRSVGALIGGYNVPGCFSADVPSSQLFLGQCYRFKIPSLALWSLHALGCLAFSLIFWPKIKQLLNNCPASDLTFFFKNNCLATPGSDRKSSCL